MMVEDSGTRVAVDINETALLLCRVVAYPTPSMTWGGGARGGAIIGDGRRYETNTTALEEDVYQAVLKVPVVSEKDYTEYTCRARNSLGEQVIPIQLQPRGE